MFGSSKSFPQEDIFKGPCLALILFGIMLIFYIFSFNTLGQPIQYHNIWDSYALQAEAWLHGHTDLGKDYPYLELATYQDRVYVSFPPVPTIPHLLLYPFYGNQTPNNLLCGIYLMLSFFVAAALLDAFRERRRLIWVILGTVGSNLLVVSSCGGVWFQAQALGFLLTLTAFYLVVKRQSALSRYLGFFCLALAVGCRPLNAVYFPLLYYLTATGGKGIEASDSKPDWIKPLLYLILPFLVALALGGYNWVRFDNPFEFGHNYLKEFLDSPQGQFSPAYIWGNLLQALRIPTIDGGGLLTFERFDGSLFFLVNPIFVSFAVLAAVTLRKKTGWTWALILSSLLAHLVLILSHKTMGGWHFGNRYFVDLIPCLLLAFALFPQKKVGITDVLLAALGVAVNGYGVIEMFLKWK